MIKSSSFGRRCETIALVVSLTLMVGIFGYAFFKGEPIGKAEAIYVAAKESAQYTSAEKVSKEKEKNFDSQKAEDSLLAVTTRITAKIEEIAVEQEEKDEEDASEVVTQENEQEESNSSWQENATLSYVPTDYEIILLAKLINRESCYEPYAGQVAVGATVMNRLKSDMFPGDTIYEVLMTPGQYDNGVPIDSYTYNDENYQAALDAINGADPTGGAVFYYNPELSSDTWIPSHVLACIIEHHWFYYVY